MMIYGVDKYRILSPKRLKIQLSEPTGEDTHMADLPAYPGTPRWVKVFGIIAIGLVLLVVIMMFIGGGDHGPGRHRPSGDAGGGRAPSSVTQHSVQ